MSARKNDSTLAILGIGAVMLLLLPNLLKREGDGEGGLMGGLGIGDITFPSLEMPTLTYPDFTMPSFDFSNLFGGGGGGLLGGDGNGGGVFGGFSDFADSLKEATKSVGETMGLFGKGIEAIAHFPVSIAEEAGDWAYHMPWIGFKAQAERKVGRVEELGALHLAGDPAKAALWERYTGGELSPQAFKVAIDQLELGYQEAATGISPESPSMTEVGVKTGISKPWQRGYSAPEAQDFSKLKYVDIVTGKALSGEALSYAQRTEVEAFAKYTTWWETGK